MADSSAYVLISNIPADYHTADLRRFFADYVEGGKFECFHFRHRRERPREKSIAATSGAELPRNDTYSRATCSRVHRARASTEDGEDAAKYTTCCVVKMQERFVGDFVKSFHRKHWLDSNDCELVTVCLVAKISRRKSPQTEGGTSTTSPATAADVEISSQISPPDGKDSDEQSSAPPKGTAEEECSRTLPRIGNVIGESSSNSPPDGGGGVQVADSFSMSLPDKESTSATCDENEAADLEDFLQLPELRPPNIMPRGNVGTSTKFFLDAIRDCRLPAKLIGKLRLEFPRAKHRRYGQVPLEYEERPGRVFMINRKKLQRLNTQGPRLSVDKSDSGPEDDDDTCEEWERHEALHDDVQANRTVGRQVNSTSYLAEGGDYEQQPGTKQKPYEDEIELVWEKGGSGLNFYTDAQFWKSKEGDFDEQTTDDWDVDMSVYYEKDTVHDKDAVDRYDMRRSEFLRRGQHTESVFTKPLPPQQKAGRRQQQQGSASSSASSAGPIGQFEAHTRGFGRKILKQSGWREGQGLGKRGSGMVLALDGEEDGQGPREKRGVGYHGEQIVFRRPPPAETGRISSAYTRPEERDPSRGRLERSSPQLYLKFRDQAVKFHSGGIVGGEKSGVVPTTSSTK